MSIDYNNLLAAELNLDIDYPRMSAELLAAQTKAVAFSYNTDDTNENVTAYSLFLRKSTMQTEYSYRGAKSADFNSWIWDLDLDISYTRSVIDTIPFITLGTVRVVYFPSIPCMEHTDWDDTTDVGHTLGISIIPNTANTHCNVWCEKENSYVSIPGNAMLLNDSVKHSVPVGNGTRITMRLFGEIDYTWFNDKINQSRCYYLS
jgi:hypothetical protein